MLSQSMYSIAFGAQNTSQRKKRDEIDFSQNNQYMIIIYINMGIHEDLTTHSLPSLCCLILGYMLGHSAHNWVQNIEVSHLWHQGAQSQSCRDFTQCWVPGMPGTVFELHVCKQKLKSLSHISEPLRFQF